MPIDLLNFVRKWNASALTERSAAPQHFRDLCEVLDVPHPTQLDEIGASYTYEKRVAKAGTGEGGYADVWKRGYFAWEYKSKGGDLKRAYKQLNEYHEALDNPPLLIVCDFVRFEVHTKFENLPTRIYAFTLDDLLVNRDTATCALPPIEVLRHLFGDFNQLRPGIAAARVTEAAARDFLRLAQQLELERAAAPGPPKEQIAHFLMRLVFCLFADSVGLLPHHAFRSLVTNDRHSPLSFNRKLPVLFAAMSQPHGFFGADNIPYFNGGLFSDHATIELNHADLGILHSAAQHDWSTIEPAIFGTLFERSLDAAKRSMIGAHYTSTEDILLLVEPVVMDPLRRRWAAVQQSVLDALAEEAVFEPAITPGAPLTTGATKPGAPSSPTASPPTAVISTRAHSAQWRDPRISPAAPLPPGAPSSPTASSSVRVGSQDAKGTAPRRLQQNTLKLNRPALTLLQDWAAELSALRILDPACGSGNFLYVALKRLLDLWHEARLFSLAYGLTLALDPIPNPGQLFGIEIDFYAHEIASIVVWIGFLQWKRDHQIVDHKEPLLQKLTNLEHADAILRYDADNKPYEPTWPQADFIIGNPPFLGDKRMRSEMNIEPHPTYVDDLRRLYDQRVPGGADLVTYWFEKARAATSSSPARAGLLATNSISMVGNRPVLDRISKSGNIFMAWSDRPWLLNGASVRVSMLGFDNGTEQVHMLDGELVPEIHADLTPGSNVAGALQLIENESLCFLGMMKAGPFDITAEEAGKMLARPVNPNGRPNNDVVRRRLGGQDITGRDREGWIIDFGAYMPEAEAAFYEWPFEFVKKYVKPERLQNRRARMAQRWWIHGEARPGLRRAIEQLSRYIVTPEVSKHRVFTWVSSSVVPDHKLHVVARADDYFFGVLQSKAHEDWTLATCSWIGKGNDPSYNSETTFLTFPFPYPPGTEPTEADSPIVHAIADAARTLVRLRDAWLNPKDPDSKPLPEADLKTRTLTNLYNARPEWLSNAHRTLDHAVFAAYIWPPTLTRDEILARLLALNHQRAFAQSTAVVPSGASPGKKRSRVPKASPTL